MDASEALNLYDSYWFEMEILKNRSTYSSPSDSPPETPTMPEISKLRPTRGGGQSAILRSMSEDLYTKPSFINNTPASPDSVLTSQLRTIHSGKEATASGSNSPPRARKPTPAGGRRRAAKKGPASKSLSSLEFEELKGFMDLGFVFSEEDRESSLVSILPGLQRLGKKDGGEAVEPPSARRPYLSEAWAVQEKEKMRNPVMNWRVPALGLGSEIDMKDSLRLWAHSVASTVR
ncbi:unnamed protein product [Linum tenue]|uniref:Uncharacterized protein n=1 Tax=Linum tenue TaxID=586396 RepID=A0AAV0PXH9_9ROSI|nr:unnamed protein product [Linum tenue]